MANARFLYDNLITDETMLAVSSLRPGLVTSALKSGTGSASISVSGVYSAAVDKEFIVEIDSVTAGSEIGQATFRWSDGGGSWNATGGATSAINVALGDGIHVKWTAGSGNDFVLGDRWYFKGINLFNAGKMLNLDRDSRYRSAVLASPNTITISFGSPQEIKALILCDHNLTAGATIFLKGNTADAWDPPAFSEAITWNEEKIIHYLSVATTYKYWQLQITDTGNPDGYIEIGELFLGSYRELSKNFLEGYSEETVFLMETNKTPYGVKRARFYNSQLTFNFDYGSMSAADVADMKALVATIVSRSSGTFKPLWFNRDSATPTETWLVNLASLPVKHRTRAYFDMPLVFEEVVASV